MRFIVSFLPYIISCQKGIVKDSIIRMSYKTYEKEKWNQRLQCFQRYIIIEAIYTI